MLERVKCFKKMKARERGDEGGLFQRSMRHFSFAAGQEAPKSAAWVVNGAP